jgi:hypothetical protein
MYYYFDRESHDQNPIDYTHQADVWLDHAFDETLKLNVTDTFVVAQDPELLGGGGAVTRVNGNNFINRGKVTLTKEWTRQFGTAVYYGNNLIVYTAGPNSPSDGSNPSQADLLNRIEQNAGLDLQWQFDKETMGFVGYKFAWTRYTGDAPILPTATYPGYNSDSRNQNVHYGYVGVQHVFSPNLSGVARGGASYVDEYNDPTGASHSVVPYVDINATYTFTPGSFLQAGFTQDINATDVPTPDAQGHLTAYQQSSVAYLNLTHKFDAKLTGSLVGQYAYSKYKGGAYDNDADQTVSAGVSLNYQFNNYFSANLGYNFDELFSDISGRDYSRNRVYIGLGANY